jgi:predicted Zn finger-like uncharacterized protein
MTGAMLIVCPSCATSYMIDQTAVGPAGRTVRCARCKTTWFAGAPKADADVTAFVDSVIAEAEAAPAANSLPPAPANATSSVADDDFGAEPGEPDINVETGVPPVMPPQRDEAPLTEHSALEIPATIADAPSLVPPLEHVALPGNAEAEIDSEDIESFAARRQRLQARRKEKRRSSRWTAIILLLLAFNVAVVGARNDVVRYLPQTASLFSAIGLPVNLRHLKFEDVAISREVQAGVKMLVVHGVIVSTAPTPTEVPRLRFAARNATGQEVYTWTALPSRSILGPGEKLEFFSQLASPPADAVNVLVRFFTAQDAAAEAK